MLPSTAHNYSRSVSRKHDVSNQRNNQTCTFAIVTVLRLLNLVEYIRFQILSRYVFSICTSLGAILLYDSTCQKWHASLRESSVSSIQRINSKGEAVPLQDISPPEHHAACAP